MHFILPTYSKTMKDTRNFPTILIWATQDGTGFLATDGRHEATAPSRGEALRRLETIIGSVNQRGRPIRLPPGGVDEARLVESFAKGMPMSAIASVCGVTLGALYRYVEQRPALVARIRQRRAETIDRLSALVYGKAIAGDVQSARWMLEHMTGSKRPRGRPRKSESQSQGEVVPGRVIKT